MTRQKTSHVDSAAGVGRRVRSLREERGLRQGDLAFPGCSVGYISRIESGERIPSLQVLRELARRLDVSTELLATGEEPAPDPDEVAVVDAELAQRLGDRDTAEEAYARLRSSETIPARARALRGLAEIALERGQVTSALELLDEHAQVASALDVRAVECHAHALATNGDLGAALAVVTRALEREPEPFDRFRLNVLETNILIDLNRLDEAERATGALLTEATGAHDPIAVARSLWSHSRLQTARGNHDNAVRYAEQALALIAATEHTEYAARAHQLVAYIELQRGNSARALSLLDDALPTIERAGDATRLALFQLDRARALADLGHHDEAYAIAGDLATRLEGLSPVDTARALAVLADVFDTTGNADHALATYEAAVDQLDGHANEAMLTDLYRRWTNLLIKHGHTDRALEVAHHALNLQQAIPANRSTTGL